MKRFLAAALAATMMLATLLSVGLFPAAAETALAADNRVLSDGDTLFPGTRVSGWGTPVLDGTKDEEIYQGFSRISDNVDGKGSNASFDIWFANDAGHLYFYLELTVPSGNTNKTALTNNDLTRLYIDFFNQHTQVYRKTDNEYQTQILNTDTSKNQQVAGSASNYNGGQFAYFPLGGNVFFRVLKAVNAPVNGRYFGLVGLEIAVGACRVVDRRNEERMVVSAAKEPGKRREVAQTPVVRPDNEHAEHLAAVNVGAHLGVTCDIILHLLCRQEAQWVRLVAKWVVEFCRLP